MVVSRRKVARIICANTAKRNNFTLVQIVDNVFGELTSLGNNGVGMTCRRDKFFLSGGLHFNNLGIVASASISSL
jgi:hypothetical protein